MLVDVMVMYLVKGRLTFLAPGHSWIRVASPQGPFPFFLDYSYLHVPDFHISLAAIYIAMFYLAHFSRVLRIRCALNPTTEVASHVFLGVF